jgi:translation elongation factor EF-Tu-like GTPase
MTKNSNKELIVPHVNVGTIGHVDHGFSRVTTAIALSSKAVAVVTTGDYIDPTLWTPEDQARLLVAIKEVHKLSDPIDNVKIDRDGIVSLNLTKKSVREKVALQAKRFAVIKTNKPNRKR